MADITYILNDPTTPQLMMPADLPAKLNVMDFRIDGYQGATTSVFSLEHQAACCYFTMVNAINLANRNLTTPLTKWSYTNQLFVAPRAGKQLNAFYDRSALRFFYALDPVTQQTVYTVNSTDVVAHELGHAILDAVRPDLYHTQAMEIWAFHESFGDIHAIMNLLQYDMVLDYLLKETGGELRLPSCVSKLAEEMGSAVFHLTGGRMGHQDGILRSAINSYIYTEPEKLPRNGPDNSLTSEPHSFSRVFTGAWYDTLVGIYDHQKLTLPPKQALIAARDILVRYTFQALPIAPASVRFYDAMARAILVADKANNYVYNDIINAAFMTRNILRAPVRPLLSLDWATYQMFRSETDEVYESKDVIAVRNKSIETMTLPVYLMNVEAPADTFYEFDGDGQCVSVLASSSDEVIQHMHDCVSFLQENDLIRPDEHSPFELDKDSNLRRSHFSCACSINNQKPGQPEYGKGAKPKNNAGCSSCQTPAQGTVAVSAGQAAVSSNSGGGPVTISVANSVTSATCTNTIKAVSSCGTPVSKPSVVINKSFRVCPSDSGGETPAGQTVVVEWGGVTLVPYNAWTTVVSYTVPSGLELFLEAFVSQGDAHGLFSLTVDGVTQVVIRTSVAVPTAQFNFPTPMSVGEGATVRIVVLHYSENPADFDGTILGYLQ